MTPPVHACDLHTLHLKPQTSKNIPWVLSIVPWDFFIELEELDHKQSPCLPKSRTLVEDATKNMFLKTALTNKGISGFLS